MKSEISKWCCSIPMRGSLVDKRNAKSPTSMSQASTSFHWSRKFHCADARKARSLPLSTAAGFFICSFLFVGNVSCSTSELQMGFQSFWIHFPHPPVGFVRHGCTPFSYVRCGFYFNHRRGRCASLLPRQLHKLFDDSNRSGIYFPGNSRGFTTPQSKTQSQY